MDCCGEDDSCHPACGEADPDCIPVGPINSIEGSSIIGGCDSSGSHAPGLIVLVALVLWSWRRRASASLFG